MAARRKNSAEMLDVLRRLNQEERKRGRSAPKSAAPTYSPYKPRGSEPAESEEPQRLTVFSPFEAQSSAQASRRAADADPQAEESPPSRLPQPSQGRPRLRRLRDSLLFIISGKNGREDAAEGEADRSTAGTGETAILAPGTAPGRGGGSEEPEEAPDEPIESRHGFQGRFDGLFEGGRAAATRRREPEAEPVELAPTVEDGQAAAAEGASEDGTASPSEADDRGAPVDAASDAPAKEPAPPEVVRQPLFAPDRDESGLQGFFSRILRKTVGEEIPGGLKKRVEVPLVTLSLYAAVALAAMLAVALFMNSTGRRDGDRSRLVDDKLEETEAASVSPGTVSQPGETASLEMVNVGKGPGPEVRNIQGAAPPAAEPAQLPEKAPAVKDERAREPEGLISGLNGPPGWYAQIQSMVRPEHADVIVSHLRSIGFPRMWKKPMLVDGKPLNYFVLRLGPYSSKAEAAEENKKFSKAIRQRPLKQPRMDWSSSFEIKVP